MLANIADTDEMLRPVSFYFGNHCINVPVNCFRTKMGLYWPIASIC